MTRTTQDEAWQQISACLDVTAGRRLRRTTFNPVPPGTLAPEAAQRLHASVYQPLGTPAGPDTIWYVVSADGTPVAWLTHILHEFANSEANSASNRRWKGVWGSVAASVAESVCRVRTGWSTVERLGILYQPRPHRHPRARRPPPDWVIDRDDDTIPEGAELDDSGG
ncbi:hypothetical protein AB0K00_33210 [Dactylosporangium sp. NPDC049525]|uniref:hypothetical protein n=1 Tax=Dactylosporangium sp. NPDC049525 TaxID=3154730 RepID=UPI00341387AB